MFSSGNRTNVRFKDEWVERRLHDYGEYPHVFIIKAMAAVSFMNSIPTPIYRRVVVKLQNVFGLCRLTYWLVGLNVGISRVQSAFSHFMVELQLIYVGYRLSIKFMLNQNPRNAYA